MSAWGPFETMPLVEEVDLLRFLDIYDVGYNGGAKTERHWHAVPGTMGLGTHHKREARLDGAIRGVTRERVNSCDGNHSRARR